MTMTIQSSPLLRGALALDAAACAGMGALLALAAGPLAAWFGLPAPVLRGAGLLLLPCAAMLTWLAVRQAVPRLAILAVIAVNLVWIADSLLLIAGEWFAPTGFGVAFVLAQAGAVLALTAMEATGLKRSPAPSKATA